MKRRSAAALAALAVLATGVGLVLAGGGASAAPAPRDSYSNCLKHADSTFAMDQCVGVERNRLKPLLTAAYNTLLNDPNETAHHKRQLVLAQKAWLKYSKRDCAYAGGFFQGGTLEPIQEGECLVIRTRRRLADLREFAVPIGR
jgi:uncharacterized protein YecT (DUF1311 family)